MERNAIEKPRNIILERLLKKYENSNRFLHPGESRRRVMLQTKKETDFPEYDYETASVRDAFNSAAEELQRQGLVSLEWIGNRPVLSAIALNLDNVGAAYERLGKRSPRDLAQSVADAVHNALRNVETPWIRDWGESVCRTAEERCRVPAFCKNEPDGLQALEDLLKVFQCYDALRGGSMSVRAFSVRCFQNSKRFEREYQKRFLEIARKFCVGLAEICTEEEHEERSEREQMAFLGLYAAPELYEMSGQCAIRTERGCMDLSPLYPLGIALPSAQTEFVTAFQLDKIRKIIFIENRTNYNEYLRQSIAPDELVLFQGGFLSPRKRRLFHTLAESASQTDIPAFFWADIDLGGFQMFEQLKRIFPNLLPMRMSLQDVEAFKHQGLRRSDEYLSKLSDAAHEYPMFREAIQGILRYGVTIEQEAFYAANERTGGNSSMAEA